MCLHAGMASGNKAIISVVRCEAEKWRLAASLFLLTDILDDDNKLADNVIHIVL